MKLLRADVLYDAGRSINPAIDIGQVEGAFIQGMGWLTTEELWWNAQGRLMTHAPSTYKIPAISDCPEAFHIKLFDNENVEPSVFRSKAVGEPPLLLSFSVFLAIRDAVAACSAQPACVPPLRAPATPEAILDAIEAVAAGRSAVDVEGDTLAANPAVVSDALAASPATAGDALRASSTIASDTLAAGPSIAGNTLVAGPAADAAAAAPGTGTGTGTAAIDLAGR